MDFLRQFNIQNRLLSTLFFSLIGMLIVAGVTLGEIKDNLYDAKREKNQHLVELTHGIIEHFHALQRQGVMTEEEAQESAKSVIKALRYDTTNYFWINDYDAKMVMHAVKPELEGKDLSEFTDPTGDKIFTGFARLAKEKGEGPYEYMFTKPGGGEALFPKFSHIKGFQPWGWVLGTGAYVDDVDEEYYGALKTNIVIVVVLSAMLGALLYVIIRSILLPLTQAQKALHDIASGGSLSAQLSVDGKDEIAKLSQSFNTFAGKIRDTITGVSKSVSSLSDAANQLADINNKNNASIEQQNQQTSEVAGAVEQLSHTLATTAESSGQMSNIVKQVKDDANNGVLQLNDAVASLKSLSSEIDNAVSVINTLASKTDAIGSVLDVIRGIAEQTNLLALNAAIEAARAGEQGRGFAVVADEVRTLASRTQSSTQEIDEMIAELQSEAQQAVSVITSSQSTAGQTVEGSENVKNALETILHSVSSLAQMGNENAQKINEQSTSVNAINQSIDRINNISVQSSNLSADATQSGQNVAQISVELGQRMTEFSS